MKYKCAVFYPKSNTALGSLAISFAKELILRIRGEWKMTVFDANEDVQLGRRVLQMVHDASTTSVYCLYVFSPSSFGINGNALEQHNCDMAFITQLLDNRMERFLLIAVGFESKEQAKSAVKKCFSPYEIEYVQCNGSQQSFSKIRQVLEASGDDGEFGESDDNGGAVNDYNDEENNSFDQQNELTSNVTTSTNGERSETIPKRVDNVKERVDNIKNRPLSNSGTGSGNSQTGNPKETSRNKMAVSSVMGIIVMAIGTFFLIRRLTARLSK